MTVFILMKSALIKRDVFQKERKIYQKFYNGKAQTKNKKNFVSNSKQTIINAYFVFYFNLSLISRLNFLA